MCSVEAAVAQRHTPSDAEASGREVLCLDLRARDGTTMLGVRARSERFEFKVWLKVDLIYDRNWANA